MTQARRAINLSELPATQARAIFDAFPAGKPEPLASFVAEVRRRVLERAPGVSGSERESIVSSLWKRRAGGSHAPST